MCCLCVCVCECMRAVVFMVFIVHAVRREWKSLASENSIKWSSVWEAITTMLFNPFIKTLINSCVCLPARVPSFFFSMLLLLWLWLFGFISFVHESALWNHWIHEMQQLIYHNVTIYNLNSTFDFEFWQCTNYSYYHTI